MKLSGDIYWQGHETGSQNCISYNYVEWDQNEDFYIKRSEEFCGVAKKKFNTVVH